MTSTRTPHHRRTNQASAETHNLREFYKHLQWRLSTATHRDAPAITARLIITQEKLVAARRRDRKAAAEAEERRAEARTERQVQRLLRAMRAELKAEGEVCGEDTLRDLAQDMIDDGTSAGYLALARARPVRPPGGNTDDSLRETALGV